MFQPRRRVVEWRLLRTRNRSGEIDKIRAGRAADAGRDREKVCPGKD